MTTITNDTTLNGLVTDAIMAAAAKAPQPPPNREDDYRFYHCRLDYNGLKCKKVDGPSVMPSEDYTKLLFVKRYIPERLDKYVLKYQWIPDTVNIEK